MASLTPINVGSPNRLESIYNSKKKGNVKPVSPNSRETSAGTFNEASLNYSSSTLKVDPTKKYS